MRYFIVLFVAVFKVTLCGAGTVTFPTKSISSVDLAAKVLDPDAPAEIIQSCGGNIVNITPIFQDAAKKRRAGLNVSITPNDKNLSFKEKRGLKKLKRILYADCCSDKIGGNKKDKLGAAFASLGINSCEAPKDSANKEPSPSNSIVPSSGGSLNPGNSI